MIIEIYDNSIDLSRYAAQIACLTLKEKIQKKGFANFISATGSSQFEFLEIRSAQQKWRKKI